VITVTLAVYNGAGELGEQLEGLANQNYDQPWS
jgi:hypothetical protein